MSFQTSEVNLNCEYTTQYTAIKLRIYPTEEQARQIDQTFECCRYLWNQMLSDAQEFYAAADMFYIPPPPNIKSTLHS